MSRRRRRADIGGASVITGATVIKAKETKQVVPTFVKDRISTEKYEGAYVGEPQRGFQHDIISFDASLLKKKRGGGVHEGGANIQLVE